MIPDPSLIVLDTPATFGICIGDAFGNHLVTTYGLARWQPRPLVPMIVVGEILRFAAQYKYPPSDIRTITEKLGEFQLVNLRAEIVAEFARLGSELDFAGKTIPDRRVWVAATCAALGAGSLPATLLCGNSDFVSCSEFGVQIEYVDPSSFYDKRLL